MNSLISHKRNISFIYHSMKQRRATKPSAFLFAQVSSCSFFGILKGVGGVEGKGIFETLRKFSERRKQLENQLLTIVQTLVPEEEFDFWFDNDNFRILSVMSDHESDHHLVIVAKTEVHVDWIWIKYSDLIFEVLKVITGSEYTLELLVFDENIAY
ncbi:hypothetical protein ACFPOF_14340 [Cohnella soli]|uniref:DnaA N-terminal domain-containing protein n=1 Tax=Cohnella soli TaxID=425005 RepID=A0ABW0HS42_9BACL